MKYGPSVWAPDQEEASRFWPDPASAGIWEEIQQLKALFLYHSLPLCISFKQINSALELRKEPHRFFKSLQTGFILIFLSTACRQYFHSFYLLKFLSLKFCNFIVLTVYIFQFVLFILKYFHFSSYDKYNCFLHLFFENSCLV